MLHYILQTIAFQLFFLLIYDVFLKRETFFNWNRAYLLATSLLSLVLPFIRIDRFSQVIPQEYVVNLPQVVIGKLSTPEVAPINLGDIPATEPSIWSWELLLYTGMVMALIIFLLKMGKLAVMIHKNPKHWKGNLLIVKLIKSSKAFSFFHYIFLGEKLPTSDQVSILKHEQVHVEQKHTLDLLYFEALRIVFWFNPLVYMYQNRIAELHEFIADAKAVKYQNKGDYYENLLSQVFETQNLSFINPFFKKSLIKKRIVMLSKHPSKQKQLLKYALLIPMVLGMLVYTSTSAQGNTNYQEDIGDKDLKEKYYDEIVDMKKQGASFQDLYEKFISITYNEKYIQTREEYYKAKAFWRLMSEGIDGENVNFTLKKNQRYAKIQKRTYEEYLKHKKTDEAKINWENSVHGGDLRLVVENHDNYTQEEQKRFTKKMDMLHSDDWWKQLIITDGVTTKIIPKPTKTTSLNSNNSIPIAYKEGNLDIEVPFAVIEQVPVYPGCENLPQSEQKKCMAKEVSKYVAKNFNTSLAKGLNLTGRQRISVIFKIGKEGKVTGVRARAPHPELEQEAIRVINGLPEMKPGMHKGKPVIVPYSLPIVFQVKDDASEQTTTPLIEKMIAMRKQVEIQGNVSDEEQKGFDLLFKTVTGKEFDPKLVEAVQTYISKKEKTKLIQRISEVFEQIQIQGNVSNAEEEALKGFLILVTNNGLNNPELEEGMKLVEIPYAVIEQVPVFSGCGALPKEEQKKCTTDKITQYVSNNFNTKLGNSLGLEGRIRISTMFKINKEGYVEGIRARAPHPDLEKETIRVISSLPQMQPGMHEGKVITVPYSLPIVFEVKGNSKEEKSTSQNDNDEIIEKYYKQILKMEKQGATLMQVSDKYILQTNAYILSKTDYAKTRAYVKYMHDRILEKQIREGANPKGLKGLLDKQKTYKEYLEHKKTQKAKDNWEAYTPEGVIKLMVGDLNNMTTEERRRYDDKKTYLDNDEYPFYKFLISDGLDTKVLVNEKKEKKFNKKK